MNHDVTETACYEHKRKYHTTGCTACWVCETCGARGCSNGDSGAKRNGETKPPTKPGLYWFDGTRRLGKEYGHPTQSLLQVEIHGDEIHARFYGEDDALDRETFSGQWWGPVLPPWEKRVESLFR